MDLEFAPFLLERCIAYKGRRNFFWFILGVLNHVKQTILKKRGENKK
jgi:hypothetical protein